MKQNWIHQAVFYHIYPLGFCGAPMKNDDPQISYRLNKLKDWIPHLKQLHVNTVYLGPVFESSEHGYDTKDYYHIDRRLGDNESFEEICRALHANGIRIVLDGVFNHVGREFWAFLDVKEHLQSSKFCNWFENLNFGGSSPMDDPFWYESWEGHFNLVKLNLRNPEVVEHLLGAVEMWIDRFGIDGLRLDAADCVNMEFFHRLRNFVKERRPDFWLMGEIIHGDYTRWANPEALDSTTNYECYKGIYSSHNDKNYFEIAHSLNRQFGSGGIYRNIYTYNFVDNHDVNRVASVLRNPRHLFNVYTLLFSMPGAPSVYYGSEWGVRGEKQNGNDAPLRPCLDLNRVPSPNEDLLRHISKLASIRRQLEALCVGEYESVDIKNEQLVYKRFTPNQTVYVALNLSEQDAWLEFSAPVPWLHDVLSGRNIQPQNGRAGFSLGACSSMILVANDGSFSLDATINSAQPASSSVSETLSEAPLPPQPHKTGLYQHLNGEEYRVLHLAKDAATQEEMVVYQSTSTGEVWVRPAQTFFESVLHQDRFVYRFAYKE